ncbi:hypothetical protein [Maricaulis sp. CAU 1757]
MAITFDFEPENGLVIYHLSGALTVDELLTGFAASAEHPDWSDDYDYLTLVGQADLGHFTPPELERLLRGLAASDRPRTDGRPKRAAIVCPDWLAQALLHYWERLSAAGRTAIDRAFATEAQARAWLASRR